MRLKGLRCLAQALFECKNNLELKLQSSFSMLFKGFGIVLSSSLFENLVGKLICQGVNAYTERQNM